MMNKLKTSKAWPWKVAAFLPLLAFLLLTFCKSGENASFEKSSPPEKVSPFTQDTINKVNKLTDFYTIGRQYYFEAQRYRTKYDSLYKLQKTQNIPFKDSSAVRDAMRLRFQRADSAFTKVTQLDSTYYGGFLWKGRMQSILDPDQKTNTGKTAYEKALQLLLAQGGVEKNGKLIIECYKSLAFDAYLDYAQSRKTDKEKANEYLNATKDYFKKILQIDPSDKQAIESTELLKKVK